MWFGLGEKVNFNSAKNGRFGSQAKLIVPEFAATEIIKMWI